jgi:dTDP-4-dehydrorhamnose reductase
VPVPREDLDLAIPESIPRALKGLDVGTVVNCAAYTDVDGAEAEEGLVTIVNGHSVGTLARWCESNATGFVTFSTDYVFPGSGSTPYVESSETGPINAYGRSKLVGEHLALEADALVIRTSWLVSGTHPNFLATMLGRSRDQVLKVVDDQQGSPTITDDLARVVVESIDHAVTGLLHLTNSGTATWFEFARAAVEVAGGIPDQIVPCSTADHPTPAKRPSYSVLESERLGELGLDRLPPWRESLGSVVEELSSWI